MIGYSKEQQLKKNKQKKESTFGKKPNKGTFGKKAYKWNNKGTQKTKVKKTDVIDEKYLKWVRTQPCVVTGKIAEAGTGANNIHAHHIYSRNKGRNDYLTVPLMGYVHSWGNLAYHANTKDDYIKKNKLMVDDIIEYFLDCAKDLQEKYKTLDKLTKNS